MKLELKFINKSLSENYNDKMECKLFPEHSIEYLEKGKDYISVVIKNKGGFYLDLPDHRLDKWWEDNKSKDLIHFRSNYLSYFQYQKMDDKDLFYSEMSLIKNNYENSTQKTFGIIYFEELLQNRFLIKLENFILNGVENSIYIIKKMGKSKTVLELLELINLSGFIKNMKCFEFKVYLKNQDVPLRHYFYFKDKLDLSLLNDKKFIEQLIYDFLHLNTNIPRDKVLNVAFDVDEINKSQI